MKKTHQKSIPLPFKDPKHGVEMIQNILDIERMSFQEFYQLAGYIEHTAMALHAKARATQKSKLTLIPGGEVSR